MYNCHFENFTYRYYHKIIVVWQRYSQIYINIVIYQNNGPNPLNYFQFCCSPFSLQWLLTVIATVQFAIIFDHPVPFVWYSHQKPHYTCTHPTFSSPIYTLGVIGWPLDVFNSQAAKFVGFWLSPAMWKIFWGLCAGSPNLHKFPVCTLLEFNSV